MREIVETFGVKPPFALQHGVKRAPRNLRVVQTTEYNAAFATQHGMPVIFPPQSCKNCLAEWLSANKQQQYHAAESEKYAHVTFFFNGGREQAFAGEERFVIASPKVESYHMQPEMSMRAVGDAVCAAVASDKHAFVMCNLAAPDMVGHTGHYDATRVACAATDVIIGDMMRACDKHGVILCVTADHGNCEEMFAPASLQTYTDAQLLRFDLNRDKADDDESKLELKALAGGLPRVKTSHTVHDVPFNIMIPASLAGSVKLSAVKQRGGMSDVAPTVLALMGMPVPAEMTGSSAFVVTAE
jgi:2,3-bisphosphoglycerate-independent phosphoglycerate mutase